MMDFVDDILQNVIEKHCGRKIIIWGSHATAERIRQRLEEEEISFAFFIDSNEERVDGERIKAVDCIEEGFTKYYIIIPLGTHDNIKYTLMKYGYHKNKDYYYFCDCAVIEKENYYEDAHGNKIFGRRDKMNFVFLGFDSEIRIGKEVRIEKESKFNCKNGVKIEFGDYCHVNGIFSCNDNAIIKIKDCSTIVGTKFSVGKKACIKIGTTCEIKGAKNIFVKDNAILYLDESSHIIEFEMIVILEKGNMFVGQNVSIAQNANVLVCENANLFIDKDSSFEQNLTIVVVDNTKIMIGRDCMFSFGITLLSDDGHSIFDVYDKKNLNSTSSITKGRYIDIGNHVWIGCKAIILYGTKIKDGSIIGAGSIIKKGIPNNCMAVGVPARVIKENIAWSRENCHSDYITKYDEKYINRTQNI